MSSNTVTFAGSLVKDPELHFTTSGKAVTNFTLRVVTGKKAEGSEYAPSFFLDCAVWNGDNNHFAENVAESLRDKNRVLVVGKLVQDEWSDKETGDKRTKLKMTAFEVAADLTYAVVKVTQDERSGGGQRKAQNEPSF
jgi:single-strand DNA-binding protein